jgi:hypothetical protein
VQDIRIRIRINETVRWSELKEVQKVQKNVGTVDVPGGQGVGGTVEVTEGEAATGDALQVMQCTAKSVFCFIVF